MAFYFHDRRARYVISNMYKYVIDSYDKTKKTDLKKHIKILETMNKKLGQYKNISLDLKLVA